MSTILIGSSRHDEQGKYHGGSKGDQAQKQTPDYDGEVSLQSFYVHPKGWRILRPRDPERARVLAGAMFIACNNPNIGYDQDTRDEVVKWGINCTQKVNSDCSSLVRACIKYAYGRDVGDFYTGNEADVLTRSNLFDLIGVYENQTVTPLYNGDVIVTREKGHTCIVVDGNPRKVDFKAVHYPKYEGKSYSIVDALYSVGCRDTSIAHRRQIAEANGIIKYTGTAEQNTFLLNRLKAGVLVHE